MTADFTSVPWRTGRKLGRTVYARTGGYDQDEDPVIGMLDTPELAEEAVEAHNAALASRLAARAAARHGVRVSGVTGVQFGHGNTQTNVF
jgi:hypothetical protein